MGAEVGNIYTPIFNGPIKTVYIGNVFLDFTLLFLYPNRSSHPRTPAHFLLKGHFFICPSPVPLILS